MVMLEKRCQPMFESTKAREGKGLVIRAYLQAITERETPHARLFESIVSYDSIHVVKEIAEHIYICEWI